MKLAADIVAGAASSVAGVIAGIIVTPVYIALLGQEGYGVIAVFITLQSILAVLDLGLPVAVNRAVAKSGAQASATSSTASSMPAPVAAIVRLFWLQAAALLVLIAMGAGVIATNWLRPATLPVSTVREAIVVMAFAIAARWPIAAYLAVLMGAGRIVHASIVSIVMSIVTPAGAVAMLLAFGADLRVLFGWYAVCGLAYAAWLHVLARDVIVRSRGAPQGLRAFVRTSAPIGLTGVVGLLFYHADKAIVSRMVSLDAFGHYVLAGLVASVLYTAVSPVANALYPRFSALEAAGRRDELRKLYRDSSHALAAMLFPAALFLAVSGEAIVQVWTGEAAVARGVAPLLRWLAIGVAVHGTMFATYAVSQACGLEKLVLRVNMQALAVSLPLAAVMAARAGAQGAALAWFLSHLVYFALSAWQTHPRVLPGEGWRWLGWDVGLPALVSAVAAAIGLAFIDDGMAVWQQLAIGFGAACAAFVAMLAASPRLRALARQMPLL